MLDNRDNPKNNHCLKSGPPKEKNLVHRERIKTERVVYTHVCIRNNVVCECEVQVLLRNRGLIKFSFASHDRVLLLLITHLLLTVKKLLTFASFVQRQVKCRPRVKLVLTELCGGNTFCARREGGEGNRQV